MNPSSIRNVLSSIMSSYFIQRTLATSTSSHRCFASSSSFSSPSSSSSGRSLLSIIASYTPYTLYNSVPSSHFLGRNNSTVKLLLFSTSSTRDPSKTIASSASDSSSNENISAGSSTSNDKNASNQTKEKKTRRRLKSSTSTTSLPPPASPTKRSRTASTSTNTNTSIDTSIKKSRSGKYSSKSAPKLRKKNNNNKSLHSEHHILPLEYTKTPSPSYHPARLLEDDSHTIREDRISHQAWSVLTRLRTTGHEAYLVGGTVRDMLLRNIPKDYDILSSAEPHRVAQLFPRAFVLGRSFPLCHVHHDGAVLEVSSFTTNADPRFIPFDSAALGALGQRGSLSAKGRSLLLMGTSSDRSEDSRKEAKRKGKASLLSGKDRSRVDGTAIKSSFYEEKGEEEEQEEEDGDNADFNTPSTPISTPIPTWAGARRFNAIKRDFTVNGLLYDPFSRIIYDYVDGIADCQAKILRTIEDPFISFKKDPARILRGIRLAARIDLEIDSLTAKALWKLTHAVAGLPQGRLQMELGAMMAHGAAAKSLELLWTFRLLDVLLPHHSALFLKYDVPRSPSVLQSPTKTLLLDTLALMDTYARPDKPLDVAVWVAMLATPLIAEECKRSAERRRESQHIDGVDDGEHDDSTPWGFGVGSWLTTMISTTPEAENTSPPGIDTGDDNSDRSDKSSNTGSSKSSNTGSSKSSKKSTNKSEDTKSIHQQEQPSQEYLDEYNSIVDLVMLRLLSPPDDDMQRMLSEAAVSSLLSTPMETSILPTDHQQQQEPDALNTSNQTTTDTTTTTNESALHAVAWTPTIDSYKTHKMNDDADDNVDYHRIFSSLSCVLPRHAVELAGQMLKIEAEIRGIDIDLTEYGQKVGVNASGSSNRRSKSMSSTLRSTPGSTEKKMRRKGRRVGRLASNEQLVVKLLRDPKMKWSEQTYLYID